MNTYASTDEIDRQVLFQLNFHHGKDRAIPRWDLVRKVFGEDAVTGETMNDDNPSDRATRNSIERLRHKGNHICNLGDGKGYFIASTRAEYEQFKKYYLGASWNKFENVNHMDISADTRWGKVPKTPDPLPFDVLLKSGG